MRFNKLKKDFNYNDFFKDLYQWFLRYTNTIWHTSKSLTDIRHPHHLVNSFYSALPVSDCH